MLDRQPIGARPERMSESATHSGSNGILELATGGVATLTPGYILTSLRLVS